MVFLAPATTTAQALELARKSSALKVRTQVIIRWVLWLTRPGGPSSRWAMTGLLPVQRDERMLHILRTGPDEVVPQELLAGAVHARTEAEAQAMAEAFEHGREGYARTRVGRPDDATVAAAGNHLGAWAQPEADEGDVAGPSADRLEIDVADAEEEARARQALSEASALALRKARHAASERIVGMPGVLGAAERFRRLQRAHETVSAYGFGDGDVSALTLAEAELKTEFTVVAGACKRNPASNVIAAFATTPIATTIVATTPVATQFSNPRCNLYACCAGLMPQNVKDTLWAAVLKSVHGEDPHHNWHVALLDAMCAQYEGAVSDIDSSCSNSCQ